MRNAWVRRQQDEPREIIYRKFMGSATEWKGDCLVKIKQCSEIKHLNA